MTYVEGFLSPVPLANKEAYLAHAAQAAPILRDLGVVRIVEAWGDDVPRGKLNDMWMAVDAREDETVVFSWFEYPDRATRDATVGKLMNDPRLAGMMDAVPFDTHRMVWGGFESVSEAGEARATGYVDGVVLPLKAGRCDDYARFAAATTDTFLDHGALRVMDAVADDVTAGEVTDFLRAVNVEDGEIPAFGWVEWPDKPTRDAGWAKVMADPRLADSAPPFDGKRMIFGGFTTIINA